MKPISLKMSVYGFMFSLISVLLFWQTIFAENSNDGKLFSAEAVYEDEEFGLSRVSIPNLNLKAISNLEITEDVPKNPKVLVYAAYTSYTLLKEHNTYWAWVYPSKTYLFVAFKVTQKTKVKVRWEIEGPVALTVLKEFEDPLEDGGLLSTDYWYYAWLQPESLNVGSYHCKVRVKPVDENGKRKGKAGKDSCQFEVILEE